MLQLNKKKLKSIAGKRFVSKLEICWSNLDNEELNGTRCGPASPELWAGAPSAFCMPGFNGLPGLCDFPPDSLFSSHRHAVWIISVSGVVRRVRNLYQ